MNFETFLKQALKKDFWSNKKVICFKGQNYPFLFFFNLFNLLKSRDVLPALHKNLMIESIDKIKLGACLQQSFLGQKSFYWLGEYKFTGNSKNKLELLNILLNYSGPNFIAFYINDEKLSSTIVSKLKRIDVLEFEDKINKYLFLKLVHLFGKNFSEKKLTLVKRLFDQRSVLSLDQACMLIQYLELINMKYADSFYEYLLPIIADVPPSLHFLSQSFFSKNAVSFFKTWGQVYQDYSEMFWISFWSEQIFRAYHVISFLHQKKIVAARSISFRLPFSFIKRDWKRFSLNELSDRYQFLYNDDFRLKRGSTFCAIELFYFNHFIYEPTRPDKLLSRSGKPWRSRIG